LAFAEIQSLPQAAVFDERSDSQILVSFIATCIISARWSISIWSSKTGGDWVSLLSGTKNSHVVTLVERASRFVMLVRMGTGKESKRAVDGLIDAAHQLPEGLVTSLTWDRGSELAQHRRFSVATDVAVCFCDPRSPLQRGSNENTNGLLRQYLRRGTDLAEHTQDELNQIALNLNTRPRQTLG
jgi:IS30 family transposase